MSPTGYSNTYDCGGTFKLLQFLFLQYLFIYLLISSLSFLNLFIIAVFEIKSLTCAIAKLLFSGDITMEILISGEDIILVIHVACVFMLGSRYLELGHLVFLMWISGLIFVDQVFGFFVVFVVIPTCQVEE